MALSANTNMMGVVTIGDDFTKSLNKRNTALKFWFVLWTKVGFS